MFDLTSSKLLLLAVVALLVLGPKDFPVLLRTVGKYLGIIKRQADEFREQFNDAMRESELDQIKKEVETLGREAEQSLAETERAIKDDFEKASAEFEQAASGTANTSSTSATDHISYDSDGVPIIKQPAEAVPAPVPATASTAEAAVPASPPAPAEAVSRS